MQEQKQDTRKQIVVRMEQSEIKDLKQFCLDNELTITDAIKSGITLLKNAGNAELNGDYYSIKIPFKQFQSLCFGPATN